MVLQVMESATQATHAHTYTHTVAHRRMHTHIHPAESTPVLHMNDITVKFSGEVFFFGGWGGRRREGGRGGEERYERGKH